MSSGGVMLSGWLRKSPPENKLKSRHHSWKKRWFVLKSGRLSGDPNVLEYSKYQTSKKPIKTINLNDCIQIDVNVSVPIKSEKKDSSEHFIFSVVTSTRTFYLIADSIREMSTWVQCLCDLCGFNHDSNDKGDIGRQKRTFKAAQPASVNVNGTNASSSLLPGGASPVPAPSPRPEKTLTEASRPIDQPPASFLNGTINSSFSHPSQDGYEDSHSKAEISFAIHSTRNKGPDIFHERVDAALMRPDLTILRSEVDDGDTGYLHLADCDTGVCDDDSAFLTIEKTDDRRCSTDSVFAHDDGTDESKDEESPPMPSILPPKSRFLHDAGGRLDSMPTVPPPPPPTDVPALARYNGDDDDDVVDARRKPTFSSGRQFSRLPPIDDTGLYNVPPGLQRDARYADDGRIRQGSNSSSSHGSGSGFGSDGRYSAKMLSAPDYINTQESRGSGSYSGVGPLSGSSISSAGHLSASPVNLGNQIYDVPSPLSPVFPMSTSPRPSYQVPQSLEKSILTRNVPTMELNNNTENIMKSQLKGVQMLDVGALSTAQTDSTYASAQDVGVQQRPNDLGLAGNVDNTYAVPPIRPPKPSGPPQYGEGLYSSPRSEGLYSSPRIGEGLYSSPRSGEGLYSSPRSHSSSSAGTLEQATYDTVRHPSPLSPAHSTVIGTMPHLSPNSSRKMGNRNAISATNSPMATPDMTRRIDINKTPSFNSKISPLVQQSRGVSGSAPSLYDVPQPLRKSPGFGRAETKLSQSSSNSGEGSGRNSAMDSSNIYDLPRKLSDVSPNASVIQRQDAIPKVDDLSHPNYEKMAAQSGFHDDSNIQDDPNHYTAMAGVMSTPRMDTFVSQVPPIHSMHTRLVDDLSRQDVPPPVHRDLKPGRKSLGSDSGLHQSGSDRRTKNSRDSYESDEAISPPHTTVTHTIPALAEPKHFPYGASISPLGSRSGSLTSPQHNNRMAPSPTPPQRPPKSSFSSASPRSPPMATSPNQLPGRPYTPTHGSHKSPQVGHDRHIMNSASSLPPAPERPPKPANMRISKMTMGGRDESRMPPKRPPKTSMTPSTGDSLHSASSLHSMFFSHYSPSAVVPPPPADHMEREIKYIEISTTQSSNVPAHTQIETIDRSALNEPVEYIQLDVSRTQALEKMKRERQMQQRANTDTHSMGKGKD